MEQYNLVGNSVVPSLLLAQHERGAAAAHEALCGTIEWMNQKPKNKTDSFGSLEKNGTKRFSCIYI